jgi:uncharacterized LabA/DUF88 family protein
MRRVAVLVDLGFFLPRYRAVIERHQDQPSAAREVARDLWRTARHHIDKHRHEELYRILVYDCKPLAKKAHNPISRKAIDFSKNDAHKFRVALHHELVCMRKVALRLGELHDGNKWRLKDEATAKLLRREITADQLTENDVFYESTQKGVDIKFGIDIASLAYKKLVDRVVLITGDADFVPAAKLARREGLDVVLDPLWNHIMPSLHEHIDGLRSVWPKPGAPADGEASAPQTRETARPPPSGTAVNTDVLTRKPRHRRMPWGRPRTPRPT